MRRRARIWHFPVPGSFLNVASAGLDWIHEIEHDGFRVLARRDEQGVRLFSRNGYNLTSRFPKIGAAVESLGVSSCVLDGGN